jgi:hypothetical protein
VSSTPTSSGATKATALAFAILFGY